MFFRPTVLHRTLYCISASSGLTQRFGNVASILPVITYRLVSQSRPWFTPDDEKSSGNDEDKLDSATRLKMKELRLELTLIHAEGGKVCDPDKLTADEWKHLLTLNSAKARQKEYRFLGKKQVSKVKKAEKYSVWKKEFDTHVKEQQQTRKENPHINYGLGLTTLLYHVSTSNMDRIRTKRLWRAKDLNAQKIVFDASFDHLLTNKKDASGVARQMLTAFSDNRKNVNPFDMHIYNFDENSRLGKHLVHNNPKLSESPLECHSDDVADAFPLDKLIYLSPCSPNVLTHFNPDAVYVIGAVFEKNNATAAVAVRARQTRCLSAWFPVREYLKWNSVDLSLPFNVIMKILLEMKYSGDWTRALAHVPKRKIRTERVARELFQDYKIFGVNEERRMVTPDSGSSLDVGDDNDESESKGRGPSSNRTKTKRKPSK